MKNKITAFLFTLCLLSWSASAQVAMGKWRTHFAYNNITQLAQSDNKIYAVSDGALFSVDKQEGERGMEFYSKLTGLNGSNISRIEFDPKTKQLLIIYSNGNMDLLTSGGIINIPDLYNKQMSTSKEVNQIQFYEDKAYLSCDFGIVVLNLQKKEIADTYYIGPNATEVKVLATVVDDGKIYALTPNAIYEASVSEPNLVNYEYWSTMTELPGSGDLQGISVFAGKLFVQRNNKLYIKNQSGWTSFLSEIVVNYFHVSNGKMLVNDGGSAIYVVDETLNYKTVSSVGSIPDVEYDQANNTFWFAANTTGIISYKQTGSEEPVLNYYKPAGPAVNIPWNMTFAGNKLFVVPGGRWSSQYGRDGVVMIYENGKWTNIWGTDIQKITGHAVLDLMNVAIDPADDKHFFVTSYGTGLYEFKNDKFENWYNYTNSTIQGHPLAASDPNNYSRLDGAIFDQQGNLFLCNSAVTASIKVYTKNGKWEQLTYPNATQETLGAILINQLNPNQKWVVSVRSNSIIVFDDKGTIADQTDDKSATISSFNYIESDNTGHNTLVTKYSGAIYTIVQDKNGTIWVGTDIGPFLFNNLSGVYNSDYTCSRVKIPRNDSTNLADYLLVNEKIKAIAIDGANRKWIGTESSGVYLMSENGQQTIQHFTVSNSPLLSNDILSIAIHPKTGEVFFGTGRGIVSYQSDASEATDKFNNVYAYPNPVREGFNGVITITGLVENTQVKITDIGGNQVCQTVSNGSIATWDGKDVHGRKVSSGVYLAICTSEDGTQSAITKILVIN